MHPIETKNQFIELRAQGLSLDAISSQLNVPRATLGRWHHDSVEQIQRLRALQWHLLEENIGHRLEDSLQRVAQRIRKFEDELDRRDPSYRNTPELVRIIRDSRREYLQLRSLLLAPLQPTRSRTACPTGLDPQKRDKTRQNQNSLTPTSQPTNDLRQPESAVSHSPLPAQETISGDASSASPANSDDWASESVEPQIPSPSTADVITDTQPVVNTPLQQGEPTQPLTAPAASAVSSHPLSQANPSIVNADDPQPSETIPPIPHAVGVPSSDGPHSTRSISDAGALSAPLPKKHKPYWLNGHYYENPEYPEHIARAMFASPSAAVSVPQAPCFQAWQRR